MSGRPAYNMVLAKAGGEYHGIQNTKLLPAFANTSTLCVICKSFPMRLKLPLLLLSICIAVSCSWFQPTVYFFISNGSPERNLVPITVTIGRDTIFNEMIRYRNEVPDLDYTPTINLSKGKYLIRVFADNGNAISEQVIEVGGDRWVFVDYWFKSPPNNSEAEKLRDFYRFDTSRLNMKLKGIRHKVTIWTMDKQPRHM